MVISEISPRNMLTSFDSEYEGNISSHDHKVPMNKSGNPKSIKLKALPELDYKGRSIYDYNITHAPQ